MENQKKIVRVPTVQEVMGKNLPEKKFKAGAVSVTIWENEATGKDGKKTSYKTITVERSYLDKNNQWQTTHSFRVADLPKVVMLTNKAYEYLSLKDTDSIEEEVY